MGSNLISIPQKFEYVAQQNPNKTAIINGDTSLSYNEVNSRANQLAHLLMKKPEFKSMSVIAIFSDSSEWVIISMLAILKTGCTYLPLDSKYPEERIKFIIKDTETSLILVERIFFELNNLSTYPCLIIEDLEAMIASYPPTNPVINTNLTVPAYIMYTSGTTGKPNGVVVPQKGILRLVNSTFIPFDEELTFLQLAPLGFDASTFEIWGPLLHGNKLVIFRHHSPEFSRIQHFIQKHAITCLWLTAALFNAIIDEDPQILNGVKYLLTGGEALSVSHIKKAQSQLTKTKFVNGYGPTESTTFACCYQIPLLGESDINSIPIGKPIDQTFVFLLDKEMQIITNEMTTGELYIGGDGLAIEYLNNKELTKKRFINYKIDDQNEIRLYKTGDLCKRLADGNFDFVGRIDHQVKINGFRIEITGIEACLKNHPSITDALILVKQKGEIKKLIAYIIPKNEATIPKNNVYVQRTHKIDTTELNNYLSRWLPAYMIPGKIIEISNFPITTNGKIDREAMLKIEDFETNKNNTEQFDGTEQKIHQVSEKILCVRINNKNEDLFKLGAESLSIAQLLYHIEQQYNIKIPINHFYNNPTLLTIFKILHNEETEDFDLINERINKSNEIFENTNIGNISDLENEFSIIQIKKGTGQPVFLAPGILGNTFSFVDFAEKINIHNPLFVLEYPINKAGKLVTTNKDEIINYFITNIKKVQPTGEYNLLGYSFGGRFVLDIANRLECDNNKINFLGIVDSEGRDNWNLINTNRFLFEIITFLRIPVKLKIRYFKERLLRKITFKASNSNVRKNAGYQFTSKELINDLFKVWYNFKLDYKVNCNIHLFKTINDNPDLLYIYYKYLYPDLFLSKQTRGNLHIKEFDCDHGDIFREPYLIEMTTYIEQQLNPA